MATRSSAAASSAERLGSLDPDLDKLVNAEAVGSNVASMYYVRSWMAIVGGGACGVLGLTGLAGLVFYVALHVLTSLALLRAMRFDVSDFVPGSPSALSFALSGMGDQALSFILFWTLAFALVHMY